MGKNFKIVFIEGPQGSGKTTIASYVEKLGYRLARGIPVSDRLIANSEKQNWEESLVMLKMLLCEENPLVMDRSIWSLAAFTMRKKPEHASLVYKIAKNMFCRRVHGINYKVLILMSSAQECISRSNPASLLSIKSIKESEEEIYIYQRLFEKLKNDGIEICSIDNQNIPIEEFFERVVVVLD